MSNKKRIADILAPLFKASLANHEHAQNEIINQLANEFMPENTVSFTGIVSGDGSCFCFNVSEDEYKRFNPGRLYTCEKELRDVTKAPPGEEEFYKGMANEPWRLDPGSIMDALDVHDGDEVTLEIRLINVKKKKST